MYQQTYGAGAGGSQPNKSIEQLSILLGLTAAILLAPIINEWLDTTSLHEFLIAKYTIDWAWLVEGALKLIVFAVTFSIFRAFISLTLISLTFWTLQRLPAFGL